MRARGVPVKPAATTDLSQLCRSSTETCRPRSGRDVTKTAAAVWSAVEAENETQILKKYIGSVFAYRVCHLLKQPYWKLTEVAVPFLLDAPMHAGPAHGSCTARTKRGRSGARPLSRPCEGG